MADISQIGVNNNLYNIKDAAARDMIKIIDIQGTTSTSAYNGYYYATLNMPTGYTFDQLISTQVIESQSNRPCFVITSESDNFIRVYSVGSNDSVTVRAIFLNI